MKKLILICTALILALPAPAVSAEDVEIQKKLSEEAIEAQQRTYKLKQAIKERSSREEQRHLRRIYGNYNIIETVETVRGDVKNAVEACGNENPDIKDQMVERYTAWDGAIDPIVIEAKANIDNMILVQDYATAEEINQLLESISYTRSATAKQFEKIPVTTKEACLFLRGKMDETEAGLLKMLKGTLVNYPIRAETEEPEATEKTAKEDEKPVQTEPEAQDSTE